MLHCLRGQGPHFLRLNAEIQRDVGIGRIQLIEDPSTCVYLSILVLVCYVQVFVTRRRLPFSRKIHLVKRLFRVLLFTDTKTRSSFIVK